MEPLAFAVLAAVALLLGGGLLAVASARAARRRAAHAARRAQDEVAALAARVDRLTGEVERVRRERDDQGREYVITTLGPSTTGPPRTRADALPDTLSAQGGGPAGRLQQRLVTAIRRGTVDRPAEETLVSLAVRTIAMGHGVRRALSAPNRDRIVWEMRRATRQSRRARRQEVRAARREVRARRLASAREDAA